MNRAKRAASAVLVGATALVLASAQPAAAAPGSGIINPNLLPDLAVSLNAPATVPSYTLSHLTFTVTNSAPAMAIITAVGSNKVWAHLDLTGLVPVSIQSGASGLSCTPAVGNSAGGYWNIVDCTGTMLWGGSATVDVWVMPHPSFYCGQPIYADASVGYMNSAADRIATNNRAVARIDQVSCIN